MAEVEDEQVLQSFWAVELLPGKEHTTVLPCDLNLTHAVLPASAKDKERTVVTVKVTSEENAKGNVFAIASLKLDGNESQSLNLVFDEDDTVTFTATGKNPVHLSGRYIPPQVPYGDYDLSDDEDDDELELEEDDEEDEEEEVPQLFGAGKRKNLPQNGGPKKAAKVEIKEPAQEAKPKQEPKETKPVEAEQKVEVKTEGKKKKHKKSEGQAPKADAPQTPKTEGQTKPEAAQTPKAEGAQKPKQEGGQTPKPKQDDEAKTPNKGKNKNPAKSPAQPQHEVGNKRLVNGVEVTVLKEGDGQPARKGNTVHVKYVGRVTKTGKIFDKAVNRWFKFSLGAHEVISGWDVGVVGMKVGEKRQLVIPPELAYGDDGAGSEIPPKASLTFEVEVMKIS